MSGGSWGNGPRTERTSSAATIEVYHSGGMAKVSSPHEGARFEAGHIGIFGLVDKEIEPEDIRVIRIG